MPGRPLSAKFRVASITVLAGAATIAAACGRGDRQTANRNSDIQSDLTLASHSSAAPNLVIAPDEIYATRSGHTRSTVRRRVLIHQVGGADLAPATTGSPTPVTPAVALTNNASAAQAPLKVADPNSPHIAMVSSVSGSDAPRPEPSPAYPSSGVGDGYGGYGDGGYGHGGGGGVIIRGGHAGDDHCERRPGIGIGLGGLGGLGGVGPTY
jgi:hypothetical protein